MSTSIENLRRIAKRDVKDHTAIFDLYVVVGRDIDYLAIKFGMNPEDIMNLLEGYGETVYADDTTEETEKMETMLDRVYDPSGKGRLPDLSRLLVEEYIGHFYPGIASENPENDWIYIDAYLDVKHPGWKAHFGQKRDQAKKKRRKSIFR